MALSGTAPLSRQQTRCLHVTKPTVPSFTCRLQYVLLWHCLLLLHRPVSRQVVFMSPNQQCPALHVDYNTYSYDTVYYRSIVLSAGTLSSCHQTRCAQLYICRWRTCPVSTESWQAWCSGQSVQHDNLEYIIKDQGVYLKYYMYAPGGNKVRKAILASRSKSRSKGRWPWCHFKGCLKWSMHTKYEVSIFNGSKVIAKVKVDNRHRTNRRTDKQTDRTKTIGPDHSIRGNKQESSERILLRILRH